MRASQPRGLRKACGSLDTVLIKMDSTGESSGSSFDDWVVENGGAVELVDLLKAYGFMSRLSLKNIDFGSPEASSFASLLRFITGPSMGLTIPIEISYYSQSSGSTLPGAAVCSHRVFLPICHSNKRELFTDVRKALEFGS